MGRPCLLADPHLAVDIPTDHIVLQQVTFIAADARKARFQTAEHILVLKAACHRIHGAEQHGDDRLFRQVTAQAHIGADAVTAQHHLQQRTVALHIAAGHGNIAVAIALFRHKAADLGTDILHLCVSIAGLIQGNVSVGILPFVGPIKAEDMALQMGKGTVAVIFQIRKMHRNARVIGKTLQALALCGGILEELMVILLTQQRHRHTVAAAQGVAQNTLLLLGKEGEAVHIQVFSIEIMTLMEMVAQLFHTGAAVDAAAAKAGIVSGENVGKITQLIAHGTLHILDALMERLGGNVIGVKLIHQVGQLLQKGSAAGGLAKYPQIMLCILQTAAHGQQLTAAIQRKIGAAARFGQHTAGKRGKAQHLGVCRGGISAELQKIHLRLVRGVLGHKKDLLPLMAVLIQL